MKYQKTLRTPATPGEVLLYEYLKPLNMESSFLADMLDVSHGTVDALIYNNGTLTDDMAFRLATTFNTSVEFWLNLQRNVVDQKA